MPRSLPPSPGRLLLVLLAAALAFPGGSAAQDADFLFHRPRVTLGVSAGWAMPRGGSDIFDFTREELTLGERDLDAFALAGELSYRATERLDVSVEVGWSRGEKEAEYREWVGTDSLPILQTTRLSRLPVTFNLRAYLLERGRSISRFAWVPARWSPWVGIGGGWMWYEFSREGEFVDVDTRDIFRDVLTSKETVPTFHVTGGADISLSPNFLLTGQLRYSWARAELNERFFAGFEEIDLAGFQATAGFRVRL